MPMTPDELHAFATRYAAAWSSANPDQLVAFYAPGGRLQVNGGAPAIGHAEVRTAIAGFMTAFPDMQVRLDRVTPSPDGARFHWIWTGTNTGPGGTGKAVHMVGHETWTFDGDGFITQSLGHYDALEYERQLRDGAGTGP